MSIATVAGGLGIIELTGSIAPSTILTGNFDYNGEAYYIPLGDITNVYNPDDFPQIVASAQSGYLVGDHFRQDIRLDGVAGRTWVCKTRFKLTNHDVGHYEASYQNEYIMGYVVSGGMSPDVLAIGDVVAFDQPGQGYFSQAIQWADAAFAWAVDWIDDGDPVRSVYRGRVSLVGTWAAYGVTAETAFEATNDWQYMLVAVDEVAGTIDLYVWNEGDSQPSTPTLSCTWTPAGTPDLPSQYTLQAASSGPGPWSISVDYITMCGSSRPDGSDCTTPIPIEGGGGRPGYLPIFRPQIGDPTTTLDSFICQLESGAMALDWQTQGAVQVWGGELIPFTGKTEAQIISDGGTMLADVQTAWYHWSQPFTLRPGEFWTDVLAALAEGRAVVLDGEYGALNWTEKAQKDYNDAHAMIVLPYKSVDGHWVVGDPLQDEFVGILETSLQAYAEALGANFYGSESPQRILFGVTLPWAT